MTFTAKQRAELTSVIDSFMEDEQNDKGLMPEPCLYHPRLAEQMADAAIAVFESSVEAQKYYEQETK